jgi:hypothetical protein
MTGLPEPPMKRSTHIFALTAICALLAGCPSSHDDTASNGATKVPARPVPDLSTPESAVKSYWRMLDWLRTRQQIEEIREERSEKRVKSDDVMASVAKGGALSSFTNAPRRNLRMERTILSVQTENEHRATVVARINNLSTDATAFTPTPIELFEVAPGGEFRYVLERDTAGWKIVEVWRLGQRDGPERLR